MSAVKRRSRRTLKSGQSIRSSVTVTTRPPTASSRIPDETSFTLHNDEGFLSPTKKEVSIKLPTGMAAEPYSMQTEMEEDHRADKTDQTVDCWTRFVRALRRKYI